MLSFCRVKKSLDVDQLHYEENISDSPRKQSQEVSIHQLRKFIAD